MISRWMWGPLFAAFSIVLCLAVLLLGEFVARQIDLPARASSSAGTVFDMPTWMLQEENTATRFTATQPRADELAWMGMFREGDGFRVGMMPNREMSFFDTFNRIPERKKPSFWVKTNSIGFRSDEPLEEGAVSPLRVAIFGDSSCWGWGVDQDATFGSLVGDELRTRWPDVPFEVLNFAIPGDSSAYGELIAKRFLAEYPPDILILGFGANDAKMVAVAHGEQVARFASSSLPSRLGRWLRVHSVLYASLERIIMQRRRSAPARSTAPKVPAVPVSDFEKNVVRIARLGRSVGVKRTVMVSLCSPPTYQAAIQRAATRVHAGFVNGQQVITDAVPLLNAGALFSEEMAAMRSGFGRSLAQEPLLAVTSDGCHPNRIGHRMVADKVFEAMRPHEAVKRWRKRSMAGTKVR